MIHNNRNLQYLEIYSQFFIKTQNLNLIFPSGLVFLANLYDYIPWSVPNNLLLRVEDPLSSA